MEQIVLEFLTESRSIAANCPDVDFTKFYSLVIKLIIELDNLSYEKENNPLKPRFDELSCELVLLRDKLSYEKEKRRLEMDSSFQFQDQAFLEKDELESKIKALNEELQLSRVAFENLSSENRLLNEKNCKLSLEQTSDKNKIIELTSCRDKLVKQVESSKSRTSSEWSKSRWVDGDTIQFYVDACERDLCGRKDVVVMGPSVSHAAKLSDPVETIAILEKLYLRDKDFVLCCVNDSGKGLTDDSGSHWSLLLIDNRFKQAFHLDSIKGYNSRHARELCVKLGIPDKDFNELPCTQQKNNFECGLSVMVHLKIIVGCYIQPNTKASFLDWYLSIFNYPSESQTCKRPELSTLHSQPLSNKNSSSTRHHVQSSKTEKMPSITSLKLKRGGDSEWRVVSPKHSARHRPVASFNVSLENSYDILVSEKSNVPPYVDRKITNTSKVPKQKKSNYGNTTKSNARLLPSKPAHAPDITVSQHKSNNKKGVVLLLSDSHGRDIPEKLDKLLEPKLKVKYSVKPGATMENVLEGSKPGRNELTKSDVLVLFAGTNNVPDNCGVKSDDHVTFLPIESIPKHHYTRRGLHFNNRGKSLIATIISDAILSRAEYRKSHALCHEIQERVKRRGNGKSFNDPPRVYRTRIWYNSRFGSGAFGAESSPRETPEGSARRRVWVNSGVEASHFLYGGRVRQPRG
ncbi:SUMO1 sentrin specific peptidase 8 [Homalodisca vitripennis]|nr:SUMO1 sentrin specific peptidase 8 [Homalodisca vitripennis]